MNWTKWGDKKPSTPGWYWLRYEEYHECIEIIHTGNPTQTGSIEVRKAGAGMPCPIEHERFRNECEWYGPITPPE